MDGPAQHTVEELARKLDLTPQALDQRLTPAAGQFLKRLLEQALRAAHHAKQQPQGLFDRFTAVIVEDTTSIALPASRATEFPGCGGSAASDGAAAVKVLLRWDLRTGQIHALTAHAGTTADQNLAVDSQALPTGRQRCPASIATERRRRCHTRAQKSGRGVAAALQLAACDWQVWATNVPVRVLSAPDVDTVYRCRWQIELFFKRAKSLGGWRIDPRHRAGRVQIELWAKLLGVVVMHWASLLRGDRMRGVSLWKLMKVVQEYGRMLRVALRAGAGAWSEVWNQLERELARVPKQRASKRKPLAFQTLTTATTTT